MAVRKVVYQGHHPSRELFPDHTIRLRKWIHMFVRRLEQFKPTEENLKELHNVVQAITWIYNLKSMEYSKIEDLTKRILEGTDEGDSAKKGSDKK